MIKLVISDVDGTLLEEGTNQIDPEYIEVIRELKKRGIQFAAASGRQYVSMRHVFEPLINEMIFVSENGTNIIRNDKYQMSLFMDPEIAAEIVHFVRGLQECNLMLCTPETQYLEKADDELLNWLLQGYKGHAMQIDDLMEQIHQVNKFAIYRENNIEEISRIMKEKFGSRLNIAVSGRVWVDIMQPGMGKGHAVKLLQEQLGIKKSETIVFGDNCNDLSMFAFAEETYAVERAHPTLIAAAKHVIPSPDKKGVLHVMKKLLI